MSSFPATARLLSAMVAVACACAAGAAEPELLVDPTAPLFAVPVAGDGDAGGGMGGLLSAFTPYRLSSILIRPDDRLAVINARRVREGDMVGAARVTAIDKDGVTLDVDGNVQTLRLYENSIKTLVNGEG